jgi:hypothetical protein
VYSERLDLILVSENKETKSGIRIKWGPDKGETLHDGPQKLSNSAKSKECRQKEKAEHV